MSRPTPLHGQLETALLDYRLIKRRAEADGRIDERESTELRACSDRINRLSGRLVRTVRHITTCLTGTAGMDSPAAIRSFEDRQAETLYAESIAEAHTTQVA